MGNLKENHTYKGVAPRRPYFSLFIPPVCGGAVCTDQKKGRDGAVKGGRGEQS